MGYIVGYIIGYVMGYRMGCIELKCIKPMNLHWHLYSHCEDSHYDLDDLDDLDGHPTRIAVFQGKLQVFSRFPSDLSNGC